MWFLGMLFILTANFSDTSALFWVGVAFLVLWFIFDED